MTGKGRGAVLAAAQKISLQKSDVEKRPDEGFDSGAGTSSSNVVTSSDLKTQSSSGYDAKLSTENQSSDVASRSELEGAEKKKITPRGRGGLFTKLQNRTKELAANLEGLKLLSDSEKTETTDQDYEEKTKKSTEQRQSKVPHILEYGDEGRSLEHAGSSASPSEIKYEDERRGREQPKSKPPPVMKHGNEGRRIDATANYLNLELTDPNRGIYEYEVRFEPNVDLQRERCRLVGQYLREVGVNGKIYDAGALLFIPQKLPEEARGTKLFKYHEVLELTPDEDLVVVEKRTVIRGTLSSGAVIQVTIIYKRKLPFKDCHNILNVIFKRIINKLELVKFGRNSFNPRMKMDVPKYGLTIWPGCVVVVNEYEGGIQLCLDATHRVLRTDNCYNMLNEAYRKDPNNFRNAVSKLLIGMSVLTTYNNKVYKVDDVNFDANPMSTFERRNGTPITYMDYYSEQYNVQIKDPRQPLLVHRVKRKGLNQEDVEMIVHLIPEFCRPTGLTDEMRSNRELMRAMASHTRTSPEVRQQTLRAFVQGIIENPKAAEILHEWGLRIPKKTVDLMARVHQEEIILYGNNRTATAMNADWTRATSSNPVLLAVDLVDWAVIYPSRDKRFVNDFLELVRRGSSSLCIRVREPQRIEINTVNVCSYTKEIRNIAHKRMQIIVTVIPSNRDDQYDAIKKLCYTEIGVASQVVTTRTLGNKNIRSIALKIMLQINCKVGGSLWGVTLPFRQDGLMICGLDVYHDPTRRGASIVGYVSSTNDSCTKWMCRSFSQKRGQEISEFLKNTFKESLEKFFVATGRYPANIFVYRDGVGDGELKVVRDFEAVQLKELFPLVSPRYRPTLTYVVVQKRINTRIYAYDQKGYSVNPPPGTVVDHTITKRNWYDFFLVSQSVREGTISPTHYVIVHDDPSVSVDIVQKVTYKMTHLYYNWTGTIRVPAPCQYAHKLAYLVGEHTHASAFPNLQDTLYFL